MIIFYKYILKNVKKIKFYVRLYIEKMKRIVSEQKSLATDTVSDETDPISPMHFLELKAHSKLKGLAKIADFCFVFM